MEVIRYFDEQRGKMIDVVPLEDVFSILEEVKLHIQEKIKEQIIEYIDTIDVGEFVGEYIE